MIALIMEIPVSCNRDCGGGCPLTAVVEDGRIVRIKDSPLKSRWMSGCIRGYRSNEYRTRPGRLTQPMLKSRRSGSFSKLSWDDALDIAADRLSAVKACGGPLSIMRLGGSGACRGALHNTYSLAARFLNLYGGYTETAGNFSSAAVSFVTPFVFGTKNAAVDAQSLLSSRFVFMPGANIADLRFGAELMNVLRELRSRGVEMIITDPRRSRTAEALGAEWIGIRPGTDAALMAAVIYDLYLNGGIDQAYVDRYCHGFDDIVGWLAAAPRKTPEWAAEICGCSPSDVLRIADAYRRNRPAALIPGLSIQRTLGGEDASRMAMALQAVTGNTGRPGGSSGGNIWGPMPNPECGRLDPNPHLTGERGPRFQKRHVPVYRWAGTVLDRDLTPPIKFIYNCGGNYITQGPDEALSAAAFAAVDFSISHDHFMTPTAAASDLVLPAADFLERSDIVFPEGNFLLYSKKAADAPESVKTDYEIFSLLAARLGFEGAYTESRDEDGWLDYFISRSDIGDPAAFKKDGIYYGEDQSRIALSDFIRDPGAHPLRTPSGKIEISSSKYSETGASPFPVFSPKRPDLDAADGERIFSMISPHSARRVNSQQLAAAVAEPALTINEDDASALGLVDGSPVTVESSSGKMSATVRLSRDIISGVVSMEAGCWELSPNRLSSSEPTMPSRGARTHTIFVKIRADRAGGNE